MTGFLFAFLATLLAALGARDQLLVAQLAKAQGQRVALLAVALACALGASAAAAKLAAVLLGAEFAGQPAARFIFAGLSLVLAGGEALLLGARRAPEEPTRSLFAAGVVLLAQQVTDAVRFLILGLALATSAPVPAVVGKAMSGRGAVDSGKPRPTTSRWSIRGVADGISAASALPMSSTAPPPKATTQSGANGRAVASAASSIGRVGSSAQGRVIKVQPLARKACNSHSARAGFAPCTNTPRGPNAAMASAARSFMPRPNRICVGV